MQEVRIDQRKASLYAGILDSKGFDIFFSPLPKWSTSKTGKQFLASAECPGVAVLVNSTIPSKAAVVPDSLKTWFDKGRFLAVDVFLSHRFCPTGKPGNPQRVQMLHDLEEALGYHLPDCVAGDFNESVQESCIYESICFWGYRSLLSEAPCETFTFCRDQATSRLDDILLSPVISDQFGKLCTQEMQSHGRLLLSTFTALTKPSQSTSRFQGCPFYEEPCKHDSVWETSESFWNSLVSEENVDHLWLQWTTDFILGGRGLDGLRSVPGICLLFIPKTLRPCTRLYSSSDEEQLTIHQDGVVGLTLFRTL